MSALKYFFLFTLAALSVSAQPTQHLAFSFSSPALWDLTGRYQRAISPTDFVIGDLYLKPDGTLSGTRAELLDDGVSHIESPGMLKGRVLSKGSQVIFKDQSQGTFSGSYLGQAISGTFKSQGTGYLVPASLAFNETGWTRVCAKGSKCNTTTDTYSVPLAQGMNGSWTLAIDYLALGRKLAGNATLILSSGRSLSYTVSGSTNSSQGASVFRLKGAGEAAKTSLTLITFGTNSTLRSMSGRIFGQSLKYAL